MHIQGETPISNRIRSIARRARYHLATSEEELEDIYRLRYRSYRTFSSIDHAANGQFDDAYDGQKNVMNWYVTFEDEIVSAIRLHVVTLESWISPCTDTFADMLLPVVKRDGLVIDTTRFCSAPDIAHKSEIKFLTLRIAIMAIQHFGSDQVIASARSNHAAFYQRYLGLKQRTDLRDFPGINFPLMLLMNDWHQVAQHIARRSPFLQSDAGERRAMFDAFDRDLHATPTLEPRHAAPQLGNLALAQTHG